MKIKEGYVLRMVAGSYVALPGGEKAADFNGMVTLNDTGAFLWRHLEQGCSREQLVEAVMEEYDVTQERALSGIERFLEKLRTENLVEE